MMGTHTTKTYALAKVTTVRAKVGRAKNTIVGMIFLDGYPNISCFTFEKELTTDSVTGRSSKLMIDKEKATAMVNIYCATGVPIVRGAVQ